MPDFREVMEAERHAQGIALEAQGLADEALDPLLMMHAQIRMLDALRLEIRALGMRFDYSITEASK